MSKCHTVGNLMPRLMSLIGVFYNSVWSKFSFFSDLLFYHIWDVIEETGPKHQIK